MSTTEQHDAIDLDARYGRTPGRGRRNRVIAIVTGAIVAVVVVAWVIWVGVGGTPAAEFEVVDVGHTVVDDQLVTVKFQLTVDPGESMECAAQALNSTFGIVGWKLISVPAAETRVRTIDVDVRTTELSVTGLIYRCWLT
ncbi:hypothetical protein HD599_000630 [Conyzicola lurida]|uniref:DUF4307 domain-containing protein n=1 Tax=Conyzicola lurida TaxID=1172621 RepID=A0A841AGF9_9MICO|nr:hypothetical protein [Conyzicola lurida]